MILVVPYEVTPETRNSTEPKRLGYVKIYLVVYMGSEQFTQKTVRSL